MSTPNYGTDLSLIYDMDSVGSITSGLNLFSQALVRRIITPTGLLIDDPTYGSDITQELGDDLLQTDLVSIANKIDAEFLKDERVLSSITTVTLSDNGLLTSSSVIEGAQGPFSLTLAISDVTVSILGIGNIS